MEWMKKNPNKVMAVLLIATLLVVTFNAFQLKAFQGKVSTLASLAVAGGGKTAQGGGAELQQSQPTAQSPLPDIIPKGVPAIYGKELGVSFDDVSSSNQQKANEVIQKLGDLDNTITLTGADKERYINVLYKKENGIACEYCCGARSVIFENGEPACGCAHSYAMRGLTKYLITKHGKEYTDDQLLEEAGKWKTLFFPGILQQKAQVLQQKGIALNYINLASNKYRGAEKGASTGSGSGMVGGC
ncbi:hypothetical protein HYY69_03400 [Candidatus Woesearchaeota archaeon]|nr:hypothetical protein [Candidatus Woesearchaeota archaeon]